MRYTILDAMQSLPFHREEENLLSSKYGEVDPIPFCVVTVSMAIVSLGFVVV